MPKDKIKVIGPWLAWGDHVRRGQMVRPDGEKIPVLLRSLIEASNTAQLRKDGRLLAAVTHPEMLQLLHITKASGHPLWVYEGFEAASLSRVLQVLGGQGEYLPIRTCLELVASAAEGLKGGLNAKLATDEAGADPEAYHPGVAPSEVLVDGLGVVKLAGFRVRRAGGALEEGPVGYVAPTPGGPEPSAVYGLGALLVQLLSGEAPAVGSPEPERHRSIVRRALIRVLSRPGEAVSDPVIDLIRDCMAVEPGERPDLDVLLTRLAERVDEAGDAGLVAWAPVKVAPILQHQDAGFPSEEETRQRRYVDATSMHSDEPSRETPPVRRPPREVPTILAKPGDGLSLAVGQAARDAASYKTGETEPARLARDVMPQMDHSISLPMPEVMGSPEGVPAVGIEHGARPVAGSVPMDIRSDEWGPLDSPTQAKRASGWIMVGGVLAGMIVASLVAWVLMDRFAGSSMGLLEQSEAEERVAVLQAGEAADAMADTVPVQPPPAAEEAPEAQAPIDEVAPAVAPVVPEEATTPEVSPPPAPAPPSPPDDKPRVKESTTSPAGGRFPVTFRNADPDVTLLEVRCHIGRGSGAKTVRIADAGPGPCRVIGHRGAQSKLIVSAVLTRSQSFTCFARGQRSCE